MVHNCFCCGVVFLFKQNTADELRISVLSSDVFSSDLTADFGRELPDLLLVEAADLDRGLIGSLDLEAFGHVKIDIVAVAKLQLQRPALRRGAIADAGDVEPPGKARGHTFDQVRSQRTLHAPEGARSLGEIGERRVRTECVSTCRTRGSP